MAFGYPTTRHPFHQLRDEMDRLLTGFFGPTGDGGFVPAVLRGHPAINVWEKDDALMVEMEVPGVKPNEVEASVAKGELTIHVKREPETEEEHGVVYHRRERPVGSFNRAVRLPVEVDADRVEASLHDGVLTITLPKAPSARPRKINVAGT